MKLVNYLVLLLLTLCSCKESELQKKERLTGEWCGKEIAFPANILCVSGEDTIDYKIPYADFLVVTYADSSECVSFRKNISHWKRLIAKADSMAKGRVSFMFFLRPDDIDEMRYILHREKFLHPVCYDLEGKLHMLNKFPEGLGFRSFLLDANRLVLSVGNPAQDISTEKAYSQIIRRGGMLNEPPEKIITEVSSVGNVCEMGDFDWRYPHRTVISLKNTGRKPLIIENVITSSSRIHVEYTREPIGVGKKWDLHVSYKAERPESFNKDITVYCNAKDSPLNFTLRGNAK